MNPTPNKNIINLPNLVPRPENSSQIISTVEMYTNVPADIADSIALTLSLESSNRIPVTAPRGVARTNIDIRMIVLCFLMFDLAKLIPTVRASPHLCTTIAVRNPKN